MTTVPDVPILISPSVLNADLANLTDEIGRITHADYVHLDVMDNHFVPNMTFGLPVVERILATTDVPADVHLMIDHPDEWAPAYAEAGAASVTFHAEASNAPVRLARELRAKGARASIALRPATGVEGYLDLLDEFDMVLVMTVEPGFGGQSLITGTLPKIRRTREAITALGRDIWVQVDGGISRDTIATAAAAGANMFVAGSAVYSADDPNAEIGALRETATAAYRSA
ncbi:ribulose-phosphate 3-epimerase [Ruania alba]|uniref:Ribulose-phosphate 3-epimerase n=1 Tax=Ruania alba TaxID=648782 RepID=A0A1H5FXF9_9MICO|nr:ribulose-phosphate 3-epimerase [Ruania alba]